MNQPSAPSPRKGPYERKGYYKDEVRWLSPPVRREVETGSDMHHMANMYLARDMISKDKSDSDWSQAYRYREEALKANPEAARRLRRNDVLLLTVPAVVVVVVFLILIFT